MVKPSTLLSDASPRAIEVALGDATPGLPPLSDATNTTAPSADGDLIPDQALISARTARALAGNISTMTLWRWCKAGVLPPPTKIRGRNYFNRRNFLAALDRAGPRGHGVED